LWQTFNAERPTSNSKILEVLAAASTFYLVSAVGTTTATIPAMRPFLKYWLPVLIWLGAIFVGSTDIMSAEHTSRIIEPFLRWLKPDILPETIEMVQFFVRKAAHLTEYAILAMLMFRALRGGTNTNMSKNATTKMSILYVSGWIAATLIAAADEYHQSFVPSRGAAWGDVLIDSGGAIFGLLISGRLARPNPKSKEKTNR
jgi:VanZ family protein